MYESLDHAQSKITQLIHDDELLSKSSDRADSKSILLELCHLMASIMPNEKPESIVLEVKCQLLALHSSGAIKTVAYGNEESAMVEAIGKIDIAASCILERNRVSKQVCMNTAYQYMKENRA